MTLEAQLLEEKTRINWWGVCNAGYCDCLQSCIIVKLYFWNDPRILFSDCTSIMVHSRPLCVSSSAAKQSRSSLMRVIMDLFIIKGHLFEALFMWHCANGVTMIIMRSLLRVLQLTEVASVLSHLQLSGIMRCIYIVAVEPNDAVTIWLSDLRECKIAESTMCCFPRRCLWKCKLKWFLHVYNFE